MQNRKRITVKEDATVHLPPPSAYVQTVDTNPVGNFSSYVSNEQKRKLETVVACIVLEAGGEGRQGMEAVNEVIHNRAAAQNKSLFDVVIAPKQFSCFNHGIDHAISLARRHAKWGEALRIVSSPKTNHTMGAVYYHTRSIRPSWSEKLLDKGYETLTIGHHVFYYKDRQY